MFSFSYLSPLNSTTSAFCSAMFGYRKREREREREGREKDKGKEREKKKKKKGFY